MDRFHQIRRHPRLFGSPYIRKKLISHKQCIILIRLKPFHRSAVIFYKRLICLVNVFRSHRITEGLYAGLLVVRDHHHAIPKRPQPVHQSSAVLVRRCSVRHECIVDIEHHAPVSLPVQCLKINLISRIHIMIRVKALQHIFFLPAIISHHYMKKRLPPQEKVFCDSCYLLCKPSHLTYNYIIYSKSIFGITIPSADCCAANVWLLPTKYWYS